MILLQNYQCVMQQYTMNSKPYMAVENKLAAMWLDIDVVTSTVKAKWWMRWAGLQYNKNTIVYNLREGRFWINTKNVFYQIIRNYIISTKYNMRAAYYSNCLLGFSWNIWRFSWNIEITVIESPPQVYTTLRDEEFVIMMCTSYSQHWLNTQSVAVKGLDSSFIVISLGNMWMIDRQHWTAECGGSTAPKRLKHRETEFDFISRNRLFFPHAKVNTVKKHPIKLSITTDK